MMEWGSWEAFWAMGGSAAYVWGSYGVAALLLAAELLLLRSGHRRTSKRLRMLRRAGRRPGDAELG